MADDNIIQIGLGATTNPTGAPRLINPSNVYIAHAHDERLDIPLDHEAARRGLLQVDPSSPASDE